VIRDLKVLTADQAILVRKVNMDMAVLQVLQVKMVLKVDMVLKVLKVLKV